MACRGKQWGGESEGTQLSQREASGFQRANATQRNQAILHNWRQGTGSVWGLLRAGARAAVKFKAIEIWPLLLTSTTSPITPRTKIITSVNSKSRIFFFIFGCRSGETSGKSAECWGCSHIASVCHTHLQATDHRTCKSHLSLGSHLCTCLS
jgi:hypothetical protein